MAQVMKLTQRAWNAIHSDFKGTTEGQKFRMWYGGVVTIEIVRAYDYKQGDRVSYGSYEGAIVRQYSEGMYEVRLPGGVACVAASELVSL